MREGKGVSGVRAERKNNKRTSATLLLFLLVSLEGK